MNCNTCNEMFTRLKDLLSHVSKKTHTYHNSNFFCVPCLMNIYSIPEAIAHITKQEHITMALATGIRVETQAESSGSSFPPLNCCFLCSSRTSNPFEQHLYGFTHNNTVSLLRSIINGKVIHCSGSKSGDFICKIINLKELIAKARASEVFCNSLPLVCELCNIYFTKEEYYKQHLENESHDRMKQFMIRMSHIVKEAEIISEESSVIDPSTISTSLPPIEPLTFSTSLPPLYHCGLCSLWVETTPSYVRHTQSGVHRRIEELSNKLFSKRNGDDICFPLRDHISAGVGQFNRPENYCKICSFYVSNGTIYLHQHSDVGHKRINHFVNSLPDEEEKKFLKFYIEAEAHTKIKNTPPPNYCDSCNVVHLKSESYQKHLLSDDHKNAEKSGVKHTNVNGREWGKATSKMFRSSMRMQHHPYNAVAKLPSAKQSWAEETISDELLETYSDHSFSLESDDSEGDSILSELEVEDSSSNDDPACEVKKYHCVLCDFTCYNSFYFDQHLMGDYHLRMTGMPNLKETQ